MEEITLALAILLSAGFVAAKLAQLVRLPSVTGYIVAGLAAQRNIPVLVMQVGDVAKLKGDARLAYEFAEQNNAECIAWEKFKSDSNDTPTGVVVDAMLGTGFSGDVNRQAKPSG